MNSTKSYWLNLSKIKKQELFITFMTVAFTIIMQFFFIRYASYNIEKIDYGNFVLLQVLIAGLSAIFLQIPGQAFDRFFNAAENKNEFLNEFRTLLIGINILSFFIIMSYGFFINKFSITLLLFVFILFVLINNFSLNQKLFLYKLERVKYFYLRLSEAVAKFILPIISYLYFHTLESLIIGMLIGYALSYLILLFMLNEYTFKLRINIRVYKKYFLFAYPVLFVSAFTWGISFIDRYFIDYYLSTEYVAVYSLLAVVAGVGQIIGQIYFMYAEPIIFKNYEVDRNKTYSNIKHYLKFLNIIFIILTIIAFVMPKQIYTLLLKKELVYNSYYFTTMMILLIAMFINILHTAYHIYLKLFERLDILIYIYFTALIVNLLGNYFFIPKYGIIASAFSTFVAYLIILLLQVLAIKKLMIKQITI